MDFFGRQRAGRLEQDQDQVGASLRYINKCFMEINAGLPPSPEETTLQDVKNTLDFMAQKCEYESLLVDDVFHPSGVPVNIVCCLCFAVSV